jgi:uncharacterized OsmC-like protein
MVEVNAIYEGELHCSAEHGPSGAFIQTDAPVDNHGKGEAFSPTDLVGTAMGTCMLTIMGIYAKQKGIDEGNDCGTAANDCASGNDYRGAFAGESSFKRGAGGRCSRMSGAPEPAPEY